MKIVFLTLVLALGLTACGSSSTESKTNSGGGDNGQQNMENVTDYSRCQGPQARSIEGSWARKFRSQNFEIVMTVQIAGSSTRVTNDCYSMGRSLRASVVVPSGYTADTYSIYGSDSDEQSIKEDGFNMNCNVSARQAVARYRIQGACLVMSMNGQEDTLAPAGF